jgi:single-stranded-DNA-specific exonuclease
MLEPRYRWVYPSGDEANPALVAAAERQGIPPRIVEILRRRGCRDESSMAAFIGSPTAGLHDPGLLPGAGTVVDRIASAKGRRERVMVLGDFDADGLTGLAVLVRALRAFGLQGRAYVPDRVGEGHGLSIRAVETASAAGCGLIVTADCGTSSPAEVELARAAGMDVIVTDHHHVPTDAAAPLALVNPMAAGSRYPSIQLTGAGVAFKVAQLLLSDTAADPLELADLAAIGTVADVAPLLDENRSIVRLGLARMRDAPQPGIAALLQVAGLSGDRLDAEAIGYVLAPRLNAAGRVGDVRTAARLLMTDDAEEARSLAASMEAWNSARRDMTTRVLAEAMATAEGAQGDAAIIVAGAWPVGVIGLVAGRLAESMNRPAVVFSTSVDPWRGSARAGSVDLAEIFAACANHFVRFGGHAQAAGCDMQADQLGAFRERFLGLVAGGPTPQPPTLHIDLVLRPEELDFGLLQALRLLEPTGTGNPAPLICLEDVAVTRARSVNGGHVQLTLARVRDVIDGIAFGRADLADALAPADRVSLVGRLSSRSFGGFESLQVQVLDVAKAASAGDDTDCDRAPQLTMTRGDRRS